MSVKKEDVVLTSLAKPGKITNRDLFIAWIRWMFSCEISHSYERLQALAFCYTLIPLLKKLYPERKEEFNEALTRHLVFFNTQGVWGGGIIVGISAALEEERARGIAEKKEMVLDAAVISSTKVGLMGPFAGIGDSIDWATLQFLLIAIALPWAYAGQWISGVFPWVIYVAMTYTYGFYLVKMGYTLGRQAATEILQSGMINTIILGASVLGLFMMGVLAATYINVTSTLTWTMSGKVFSLQQILDSILPGLLPFATVMLVYLFFLRKGVKMNQMLLYLIVIFFVLGVTGIL